MADWIEFISIFIEFLCFYFIFRIFLNRTLKPCYKDFIALIINFIFMSITPDTIAAQILNPLFFLIYVFAVYLWGSFRNSLILYILATFFMIFVQFIAAALISIYPFTISANAEKFIGNTLTLILVIVFTRFSYIKNLYYKVVSSALPYQLFLIDSFLIIYSLLMIFKADISLLYKNIVPVIISLILIILANICVLYYDQKSRNDRLMLESYQKNLPIYDSLISEIRANQHEYSNRIQALHNLGKTCKTYDELLEALQQYAIEYTKPMHAYPLLTIDKPLLAATLYSLSSRAETDGIIIQYDITNEKIESKIDEIQMADFTGTLLQNAIEASKSGDGIYVRMYNDNRGFHFEVRNPVENMISHEEISLFFKEGYTTKNSLSDSGGKKRGLGLYNLLNQIHKNKCEISADCIEFQGVFYMIMEIIL